MSVTGAGQIVARFGRESRYAGAVLGRSLRATWGMRAADYWEQLGRIALTGLPLVGVAALFAGMVIALNASLQLADLGMRHVVADIISVSLVRELAPVFTALLMAGKAGAGLASELGMVTLSGQAQAMRALSIDIDREVVAPRVWACVSGTVLLTVAAIFMGLVGGMILASGKLGISPVQFMNRAVEAVAPIDFFTGLFKAGGFGVIIAALGCSYGLRAKADAGDLGRHTMTAVVYASFLVLISDHVFNTFILAVTA